MCKMCRRRSLLRVRCSRRQQPIECLILARWTLYDDRMRIGESVGLFLQSELKRRRLSEVPAVEAARWLATIGLLADSESRPGLPLRRLLRGGEVIGAEQRPARPNGRWFITLVAH
jgi:hypothetical protein